ncbi:VOC family protein [Amycolatopsis sp. NPDC088138]|uniref:VOC family protein n=1 Tax=Amycolatopsis sp. NPDC088138 TaxID=3363938 RepID=UPI0037FA36BF
MRSRLPTVADEADNPAAPARFWAGLLGREAVEDAGGVLLPGGEDPPRPAVRTGPRRPAGWARTGMHLHLTSTDLDDQRHTVAATSTSDSAPRRRTSS